MNEGPGPINPACAAHPDCPSPNIHLTVLRLRVPHVFGSRRRPSSTRKPRIMSTVDKPSNRPANLSAALHIIVQDLSEKPSREDSDVRQSRSRFAKKLECYEFAILSRHLLTVSRSDQEFQQRWEGLLDKVEAAFAAVNPEHASSAEETHRERRPSIDQWIKDIVPRHLELIRAVYGRETKKYEQLMGLVGSLRQIQKNLLLLSDTVPTRQKDRRRQLWPYSLALRRGTSHRRKILLMRATSTISLLLMMHWIFLPTR
ncbi:hypothetical protein C8Q73DRAFT_9973 [Cubamyces lactineus]|nr:hypothetical protein C8Q73DRAFT_9973 [Cubamyces lactineus]